MNKERIGFIGLGNMGGRMARRLVDSGIAVLGYDTAPERVKAAGAQAAASVADVMKFADVVMMSLPDSKVVEAVVEGEGGVLAHCRAGQIVVDLSTAAASSTIRLARRFTQCGVQYVDAGISGGAAAAEKGTLTLMVGRDNPSTFASTYSSPAPTVAISGPTITKKRRRPIDCAISPEPI